MAKELGNNQIEKVKKMLYERFCNDKLNVKHLNYKSWELGFQRGIEYQQELDNRVINLAEGANKLINDLSKRF